MLFSPRCPCVPQVTVQYTQKNGAVIPVRVHTIVISVQHDETISLENMRRTLKERVIQVVVPAKYLDDKTVYHLQPSGRFVIGGPQVCAVLFWWSYELAFHCACVFNAQVLASLSQGVRSKLPSGRFFLQLDVGEGPRVLHVLCQSNL